MAQNKSRRLLWAVCLAALAAFAAAMVWLHYQQLCSPGGGSDPYTSDLGMHLAFAQRGMVYSTVSLLIGPAYALAGRVGIAVLLAAFHLAAVAVFACGLRTALPDAPRPALLLVSLVVNLATAVWMPRGGYWYQGTVGGTIYHNTTYIMLAPFALLAMLAFYRVWPTMRDDLDLRAYAVYTVLLTVATSFKASLIFAFAPALLVLLIADFVRTRAKNLKNEIIMGCSVFPGVALCFIQANVLFAEEGSGIRLIFTVPFDHHRMLWGPFNEAGVLGLARSFVFVAAVGLLLGRAAWQRFRYRFSLFTFAFSLAEALLLVESGERLYHANLWWGPFICFWVFWLESVSVFLQQTRTGAVPRWRLAVCPPPRARPAAEAARVLAADAWVDAAMSRVDGHNDFAVRRRLCHGGRCPPPPLIPTWGAGPGRRRTGVAVQPRHADGLPRPLIQSAFEKVRQVQVGQQRRARLNPAPEAGHGL